MYTALDICVANELKYVDLIVEVTRNSKSMIVENFTKDNKPRELSDEDKLKIVDSEMSKEEIKEHVKDLK